MTGLNQKRKIKDFVYDFMKYGGNVGVIDLSDQGKFPSNTVVVAGFIKIDKTCMSDGAAKISFHLLENEDVLKDIDIGELVADNYFDTEMNGTVSTFVKINVLTGLKMIIETAQLTAGRIIVVLEYVII